MRNKSISNNKGAVNVRDRLFSTRDELKNTNGTTAIAGIIKHEHAIRKYKDVQIESLKDIDKYLSSSKSDRVIEALSAKRNEVADNLNIAVLAPNKFMVDDKGEAVPYDAKRASKALAQAADDEYIKLNTIDGTGVVARHDASDSPQPSVLQEDDEVLHAIKYKPNASDDNSGEAILYAVRTKDNDNKPVNMVLAEYIVNDNVVATNEDAMHEVGLDPTMFVTKIPDTPRPGENGYENSPNLTVTDMKNSSNNKDRLISQLSPAGLAEVINKDILQKHAIKLNDIGVSDKTENIKAHDALDIQSMKDNLDSEGLRKASRFEQTTTVRKLSPEDIKDLNYANGVYSPKNQKGLEDRRDNPTPFKQEGFVSGAVVVQKTPAGTNYAVIGSTANQSDNLYNDDPVSVASTITEYSYLVRKAGEEPERLHNLSEHAISKDFRDKLQEMLSHSKQEVHPINADGEPNTNLSFNRVVRAENIARVIMENGLNNSENLDNTAKGLFRDGEGVTPYDALADKIDKSEKLNSNNVHDANLNIDNERTTNKGFRR